MNTETVALAKESLDTNVNDGFKMLPVSVPDSEDLKYYQRSTWGKLGWQK